MSVTRKIVDGALSLVERLHLGEPNLRRVDSALLAKELEARRGKKSTFDTRAVGAGEAAKQERKRTIEAEIAKLGKAKPRPRKEAVNDSATSQPPPRAEENPGRKPIDPDDLLRQFRSQMGMGGGPGANRSQSQGQQYRPQNPRPGAKPRKLDPIAKAYDALGLPVGADFPQVKAAYRKLMRRYHPDMHTASKDKQKAANELSVQVTQAYNLLDNHLNKK